jgi:hypothetical protein
MKVWAGISFVARTSYFSPSTTITCPSSKARYNLPSWRFEGDPAADTTADTPNNLQC